jgi:spore maturation protein CgeB
VPGNALLEKVVFRAQMGPWVSRLNRDILQVAERERPDIFWADKALGVWPETLDKLGAMGVATVSYMIDNAFGPRRDPGWRLYMKAIPHYDLHVVQRDTNIADYRARGAQDVIKIQTAYEPTIHFAPPEGWSDAQRGRGVSFIGTSYDDRPEFLTKLWREGLPVVISGDRMWKERLEPDAVAALYTGGELYGAAYREGIWRSKINLSFITHSNQDEFVHKSFEIAACEGFLLAERSDGHMAKFEEDVEAVFFTGFEECAEKIRRYLPDESARARIAAAGRVRALRDGYSNDAQVERIVERLKERLRPLVVG